MDDSRSLSPSVMATFLALNQAILGSNPRATTMCIGDRIECCLHRTKEYETSDNWKIIEWVCCFCDAKPETRYRINYESSVWVFDREEHGPHYPHDNISFELGGCIR